MHSDTGKPILLLGLTRKNTELLLDGRPIPIELKDLIGVDAVVLIVAGETEQAICDELREHIGPSTKIEGPFPFRQDGPRGVG